MRGAMKERFTPVAEKSVRVLAPVLALLLLVMPATVSATTKGLSQIVTPDLQPESDLSVSAQVQSVQIGNP